MGKVLIGLMATLGAAASIAGVVGAFVFFGGHIDVSADTPHEKIVFDLIQEARERAIARSSRAITPPANLSDPERAIRGAGNYQAMCVRCHLSPGMANSEIRRGLYPAPPDLTKSPVEQGSSSAASTARKFWIIKHGIKASAMPAWSKGGMQDAAIWDLTAFLNQLPTLSAESFMAMVEESDGHSHKRIPAQDHHAAPAPALAPSHVDKPGSKPHTH